MTSRILWKSTIYYQILLYSRTNYEMRINREIIAYLLINLPELFTSEFEYYLGIKVRKIKPLYFDFMSFWMALFQR